MEESPVPKTQQKARRFPCPGCGGDLVFEPQDGQLVCPYCGRKEQIPASADQVVERSYEEYLRPREAQLETIAANALEVRCDGCGAVVAFTPPEVAGECAFCGRKIVAQPRSADPLVAPEGVLPFVVSQRQASDVIKKWISSRWFAPNKLKRLAYQDAVGGVYLPFWTYDAHTTSHYSGERGEYYYEQETYTDTDAQGNRVTKTRSVRRTRWYPASGTVERWHDDVLVAATKSVLLNRLRSLEPWDLDQLQPYQEAYLSGFKAQRYEVDLSQGFESAKQMMAGVIENDVRDDIGGDEQRIDNISTSYSAVTFKHLLLPVYLGAYRFNEKIYQVMVNARTGEVQGDRPYSIWKIALLILFILIVIGVILYLKGD
ncbi:MAG TPA: TFIIB-type zinc finger domain-containing protein [Blastocatellia bacterium]|nr:TFIIB-type zinc finger domain-containing protein [Blastocatellia bacterium]